MWASKAIEHCVAVSSRTVWSGGGLKSCVMHGLLGTQQYCISKFIEPLEHGALVPQSKMSEGYQELPIT